MLKSTDPVLNGTLLAILDDMGQGSETMIAEREGDHMGEDVEA